MSRPPLHLLAKEEDINQIAPVRQPRPLSLSSPTFSFCFASPHSRFLFPLFLLISLCCFNHNSHPPDTERPTGPLHGRQSPMNIMHSSFSHLWSLNQPQMMSRSPSVAPPQTTVVTATARSATFSPDKASLAASGSGTLRGKPKTMPPKPGPNKVIKRAKSTPQLKLSAPMSTPPMPPASPDAEEKKRNKLGYHRTSVACGMSYCG